MRQQIRQVLPIINMMTQVDPESAEIWQMAQQIIKQFEPIAEEQIIMLAMMLNK